VASAADPAADCFDEVVDLLDLSPLLERRIDQISGGEARRTALGRALLMSPEFLLLDEPLTGEFLAFLSQFGTVRTLNQLKRPYFSFEKEHFISIKGFTGDCSVEVRYKKEFYDLVSDYFHLLLYYYRQGKSGISTLKGVEDSIRKKMKIRMDPPPGGST
jgi:translation initiation factor RLI1